MQARKAVKRSSLCLLGSGIGHSMVAVVATDDPGTDQRRPGRVMIFGAPLALGYLTTVGDSLRARTRSVSWQRCSVRMALSTSREILHCGV